MNPMLEATLRRNWHAPAALLLLLLLTGVNQLWFRPTAARYARALRQATELGMPLDPNRLPRIIPPRLFALIADNSLTAAQAQEATSSGGLTAEFLGDLTERMSKHNITLVSTEPGPTTQDPHWIQLRAHVKARSRYSDFVLLLQDLARDPLLIGVDRFTIAPEANGGVSLELWMSRLVIKIQGQP